MTAEAAGACRLPGWQPVAFLIALTAIMGLGFAAMAAKGSPSPGTAGPVWAFWFNLGVAWWVHADRYARSFRAPFEFDAFVFFAWPVLLPYYLYRTRRRRGLALAIGFYGLYVAPAIPATIIYVVHAVASLPR